VPDAAVRQGFTSVNDRGRVQVDVAADIDVIDYRDICPAG
jgi:hypothetical protein